MAPPLTHNDYTVAWICAVEVERIAACELLDEEYPRLPKQPHDNNTYSFGRIGSHKVVIAGLPSGKYGVSSAATVANDLLRSFPYIRIGLMVGIAGGAPTRKHDIRLGDVVISSPTGETGGVIHYDFGKVIQNREFEHKGSLNAPPIALLTALHDIRALHARKGHRIVDSVNEMIQRNPRLRKKFKDPGLEQDRLYATNYVHVHDDQPCVDVCDDTTLITRKPRSEDEDNPAIYYGLIASADKLMKDATIRDRLATEYDVLCFEMEAAGLMDNFPCLVIRGICDYSDTHKNDQWQGYAAATAAAYAKELLQAMPGEEVVRTNRVLSTESQPAPSAPPKPVFTVPFERDRHFVGREEIISQIEERLQEQYRASLSGWGGMGKSQIAIEYAHRFRKKHPQHHIFWVYAANPSRFYQAYQEIARRLEIPRHDDPAVDVRGLVLDWLNEQDAQWLMILDNADDAALFFPNDSESSSRGDSISERPLIEYLPSFLSSTKLLLITTRRKSLGEDLINGEQCIEVPPFTIHEALLLLQERSKDPASSVNSLESTKLMDILGCIPLAINQAAAFIRRNQMSLQEYLAALEKDEKNLKDFLSAELQDPRRERGSPNAIFRTWKLSFSQIQDQEPRAAELLSLMALFDRRDIPESLLRHPEDSDHDFSTAIGTLKTFALIVQETDSEKFAMHRLVQLSIHHWLEQAGNMVDYDEQALQRLGDRFPYPEYENMETCRNLYPHAQAILRHNLRSKSSKKARARLLYVVGRYEFRQGSYNVAESQVLEALRLFEEVEDENSVALLNCRVELGVVLNYQGKHKEAEKMHKQTLELSESVLGKNHFITVRSMHNLAEALVDQGKYAEAEEMYQKTLELREAANGKDHPYTLSTLGGLARTMDNQGKYEEAEKMYRHLLKNFKTILGEKHPETLMTMHNLAGLLENQQKYKEAEEMWLQVLKSQEMVLGKKHPNTLITMHNLALVLEYQQKYKEAEDIYLQALDLRESVLGKQHADTLMTVWYLASLYEDQQRYKDARPLYQRASTGFQKTLGPNHPRTLRRAQEYEDVLEELGIKRAEMGNDVQIGSASTTASLTAENEVAHRTVTQDISTSNTGRRRRFARWWKKNMRSEGQ